MSNDISVKNPQSPAAVLAGRRIVLVVTGGVAAYKAADLARRLIRLGAQVRVALTENGARFITPLTFESLTGQPVAQSMWNRPQVQVEHVAWADWAEALLVVPATADFIAKTAQGLADDFASTLMLAYDGPKLLAPSMNTRMLTNPATADNLNLLSRRGLRLVDSAVGPLACGTVGAGKLPEPENLVLETARLFERPSLAGRRILVTAGATWEAWDDIRILTNRSTGLMGRCLAQAAWLKGAQATLISGPAAAGPLYGVEVMAIQSTEDMLNAARRELPRHEALIMAAAPADFRPAETVPGKIKKGRLPEPLPLAANPDILKSLLPLKQNRWFVGFAAESEELPARARAKLEAKKLDLIVANQAGGQDSAFGRPDNRAWLIYPDKPAEPLPEMPKFALAGIILDRLAGLMEAEAEKTPPDQQAFK